MAFEPGAEILHRLIVELREEVRRLRTDNARLGETTCSICEGLLGSEDIDRTSYLKLRADLDHYRERAEALGTRSDQLQSLGDRVQQDNDWLRGLVDSQAETIQQLAIRLDT